VTLAKGKKPIPYIFSPGILTPAAPDRSPISNLNFQPRFRGKS